MVLSNVRDVGPIITCSVAYNTSFLYESKYWGKLVKVKEELTGASIIKLFLMSLNYWSGVENNT